LPKYQRRVEVTRDYVVTPRGDYEHRAVYRRFYGPIPKGYHVHHIDADKGNNDPKNLIALKPKLHGLVHQLSGEAGLPNRAELLYLASIGIKKVKRWLGRRRTKAAEARRRASLRKKRKQPFARGATPLHTVGEWVEANKDKVKKYDSDGLRI